MLHQTQTMFMHPVYVCDLFLIYTFKYSHILAYTDAGLVHVHGREKLMRY